MRKEILSVLFINFSQVLKRVPDTEYLLNVCCLTNQEQSGIKAAQGHLETLQYTQNSEYYIKGVV